MKKIKRSHIFFLIVIVLLVIPQTRTPIQVLFHKGVALVNTIGLVDEDERKVIESYNWKLLDENSEVYNFENSREKIIVVNFWATWCPPCIAEMPSLQKLYNKYGEQVVFMFVTGDELTKVEAFKQKNNYSFPVFKSVMQPPQILMTSSIPRTLLINQKGEIIIDKSGAVDWFSEDVQKEIDILLKSENII